MSHHLNSLGYADPIFCNTSYLNCANTSHIHTFTTLNSHMSTIFDLGIYLIFCIIMILIALCYFFGKFCKISLGGFSRCGNVAGGGGQAEALSGGTCCNREIRWAHCNAGGRKATRLVLVRMRCNRKG